MLTISTSKTHETLACGLRLTIMIALVVPTPICGEPPTQPPVPNEQWDIESSQPTIAVGLNGSRVAQVYRGWPWLATVYVRHPQAMRRQAKPVVVAAKDGPWSNAVRLEVRSDRGEVVAWPFDLSAGQSPKLTLDAKTGGNLQGWLTPEATATVSVGKFGMTGALDTNGSSVTDVWKGRAVSQRVVVDVRPEPTVLSAALVSEKHLCFARFHLARGEAEKSQAQLEDLLKKQPENLDGLSLQTDLLARAGKVKQALGVCQKALDVFAKKYPDAERPPVLLLQRQRSLVDQLIKMKP